MSWKQRGSDFTSFRICFSDSAARPNFDRRSKTGRFNLSAYFYEEQSQNLDLSKTANIYFWASTHFWDCRSGNFLQSCVSVRRYVLTFETKRASVPFADTDGGIEADRGGVGLLQRSPARDAAPGRSSDQGIEQIEGGCRREIE